MDYNSDEDPKCLKHIQKKSMRVLIENNWLNDEVNSKYIIQGNKLLYRFNIEKGTEREQ
jgi:hypothetical protein